MNKEIRRLSNFSSLPVLIFVLFMQLSASAIQIGVSLLDFRPVYAALRLGDTDRRFTS